MDVHLTKRILLAFLFCCLAPAPRAFGQNGEELFIKHTPLKSEAFEKIMPGKPLKLSVALAKTRSIDMRIRAFVLVDGRIMDVPMKNPTYNDADELVFSAEIPAPLERVSYQFFVYGNDSKKAEISQKYLLERKCIPIYPNNQAEDVAPVDPSNKQEVGALVAQNADLERELDLLSSSLATLKKIEASVK